MELSDLNVRGALLDFALDDGDRAVLFCQQLLLVDHLVVLSLILGLNLA